jgi:adenosine kinase
MLSLTEECRQLGIPFAADPSQQLARLTGSEARRLVAGARFLFTNDYEAAMLKELSGWTEEEVLDQVGAWIITRGASGADIGRAGRSWLHVDAVATDAVVDPTGVGDAFRAGFLASIAWGLPYEPATRLGCALAAVVLQVVGTQEYDLTASDLLLSVERSYGNEAARELRPYLTAAGPSR